MAIRQITKWHDERFDKTSRAVEKFDARLHALLDDMLDSLREVKGYGCAAIHVGVLRRVVVIDDETDGVIELVNPVITEASQELAQFREGSIAEGSPVGMVNRPTWVVVTAQDRQGESISVRGEDFLSATLCHEIDHLDGVRFSSKLLD